MIYASEGDGENAGISLASAVPFVGPALKIGSKGAKLGKEVHGGVYSLVDRETGKVMPTGRTNDLARREGEHARDPRHRQYDFRVEERTDRYAAQRGLEQLLPDKHRPPLNRINPINPRNPRRGEYMRAADEYLNGPGG